MTGLGSARAPANLASEGELYGRMVPKWEEATERTAVYNFRNRGNGVGQVDLFGPIGMDFFGDGITSKSFAKQLRALGDVKTLQVNIDSPGGSVTDASSIYTLLSAHPARVEVNILGLAASAASYIAMVGDEIAIGEAAFMMIHEARGRAAGTAGELRKAAESLDMVTGTIADLYVSRTGISRNKVDKMMADETWFTADEAVKQGFADRVIKNERADGKKTASNRALLYAEAFGSLPPQLRGEAETGRARALRILRDAREVLGK